jgi:hypothetical protein
VHSKEAAVIKSIHLRELMTTPASWEPLRRGSDWVASLAPQQGIQLTPASGMVTRSRKRQRKDTVTFIATNKTLSFEFLGRGEGKGASLDEVAWHRLTLYALAPHMNDAETRKNGHLALPRRESRSPVNVIA